MAQKKRALKARFSIFGGARDRLNDIQCHPKKYYLFNENKYLAKFVVRSSSIQFN
jgi:hypothetical protein